VKAPPVSIKMINIISLRLILDDYSFNVIISN
jgi:hypothetical protein